MTGGVVEAVFGHVAVFLAQLAQAADARLAVQLLQFELITGGFGLVDVEQDFFGGEGAEAFLYRLQNLEAELGVAAGEELAGPVGQAVSLFRAAHALGAAPGVEVTFPLQADAVLLDAHVGEADPLAELGDGKALAAFNLAKNGELGIVVGLGVQPGLHSEGLKFQPRTDREATPEL